MKGKDLRIAVIRLSSLGDIVHTLPSATLIKKILPNSKISWIVEPPGAKLLESFHCYDEIIPFRIKSVKGVRKISELRTVVRQFRNHFDVVFDFQGLIKSAVLSFLLKGYRFGFHRTNLKEESARFFYNKTMAPFDENRHVIFKNWCLVRSYFLENLNRCELQFDFDSLPPVEIEPQYSLKKFSDSPVLLDFLKQNDLITKKFILLNVGGGWETKILSSEQYISLVRGIQDWLPVVLLWGNPKEKELAELIKGQTNSIVSDFFDFRDLIKLIQHAGVVVTADTLALHLADVVNTPSVGIFGPSSPFRNGSLLKKSVSIFEKIECGFCYLKKCDRMYCLKNISIERIIRSIKKEDEKDC